MPRQVPFRIGFAICLSLAAESQAIALEPATPLSRFGRQAWTMENGLPQNTVSALLQAKSGFLWAGTEQGLARFDGAGFMVFNHANFKAVPEAEIRCLLDGADGALWVGTSDGLVRMQGGVPTLLTVRDGLPSNSIDGLAQSSDGTVWVWTEAGTRAGLATAGLTRAGLVRWDGRQFREPPLSGFPAGKINSIAANSIGGLWVGTTQGGALFQNGRWYSVWGAKRFAGPANVKALPDRDVLIASESGLEVDHGGALAQAMAGGLTGSGRLHGEVSFLERLASGEIAVASKSEVLLVEHGRVSGRFSVSLELPGSRMESLYADREGALWIGTNRGLARILRESGSARVQRMPASDPLANKAILTLMEDREGDLWAGTDDAGVHILRDIRFRMIGGSDGLDSDAATAIVQDDQQRYWIGTRDAGLNRVTVRPDGTVRVKTLTASDGLLSNVILSLAVGADGDLWVGTPDGLNRIGLRFAKPRIAGFTSADGLPDDFIRSILVAPDASIWIGTRRGLTHWDHGRFFNFTHADGLGSDLVGALAQGAEGDLWVATLAGLTRLREGKLTNYTTANGLSSNVITALTFAPDGSLWIGTQSDGLNLWNGSAMIAVGSNRAGARRLPNSIHAILADTRNHLWLATEAGLTRADLSALRACAPDHICDATSANAVNFSTVDGLRSRETSSNSHPTASRANDGTLWFTTPRGVAIVDPVHFPADPPLPPVAIERFAVDDGDMQIEPEARIRAGALRFEFDYAGLSFASPQKLRYRYMLEGFDHGWNVAGTRRTAYYTNIPAGTYRFRVQAALGEGEFSKSFEDLGNASSGGDHEASYRFVLEPHYYQTAWFRTLAFLSFAALLGLVFRRRVQGVEREFRAVMGERNRIAREIHDTLAQGYVGISLQLEILGELLRLNRAEEAQKHLAVTQTMVREGLDDARQSIWALRSHDAAEQTLPTRLRRLVDEAGNSGLSAELQVYGAYRLMPAATEQEVLRIAQEAIQNVKKHAAARHLQVSLNYGEQYLQLKVADDGVGFEVADEEHRASSGAGGYGLTGMRERASLIRGEIAVASRKGTGAAVELTVPMAEAEQAPRIRG